jgi:hypothetical protein
LDLTHLVTIPDEEDWQIHFYWVKFDSKEPCFIADDILKQIDNGDLYSIEIPDGMVSDLDLPDIPNPIMTIIFSINNGDSPDLFISISPGIRN